MRKQRTASETACGWRRAGSGQEKHVGRAGKTLFSSLFLVSAIGLFSHTPFFFLYLTFPWSLTSRFLFRFLTLFFVPSHFYVPYFFPHFFPLLLCYSLAFSYFCLSASLPFLLPLLLCCSLRVSLWCIPFEWESIWEKRRFGDRALRVVGEGADMPLAASKTCWRAQLIIRNK